MLLACIGVELGVHEGATWSVATGTYDDLSIFFIKQP